MIEVDISNIWGRVSLPELLAVEGEVFAAHQLLSGGKANTDTGPILAAAQRIRETSDVLVVIGMGEGLLGARGVTQLLRGPEHNLGRGELQIFFAGDSLSTRRHQALLRLLEGKEFSLCVISEAGDGIGPAVALRSLRWILERRYGTDEARKRIYAVTDTPGSTLAQMAAAEGWELFQAPQNTCLGSLSVGLLPMAAAGIDIGELLRGAGEAKAEFDLRSFENPVWLYAASRSLLYRKGCPVELLAYSEPGFGMLGQWWQRLFSGAGPFPAAAQLREQPVAAGEFFETILCIDGPEYQVTIGEDVKNLDALNYLAGNSLDQVEEMTCQNALEARTDRDIPVVTISCGALDEGKLGELITFFLLSSALSQRILESPGC